jgi:hypothetical protein
MAAFAAFPTLRRTGIGKKPLEAAPDNRQTEISRV